MEISDSMCFLQTEVFVNLDDFDLRVDRRGNVVKNYGYRKKLDTVESFRKNVFCFYSFVSI